MIKQTTTPAVLRSQKRKKGNQVRRKEKQRTDAAKLGISTRELQNRRFAEGQKIRDAHQQRKRPEVQIPPPPPQAQRTSRPSSTFFL